MFAANIDNAAAFRQWHFLANRGDLSLIEHDGAAFQGGGAYRVNSATNQGDRTGLGRSRHLWVRPSVAGDGRYQQA
jgi:hypothetical protein